MTEHIMLTLAGYGVAAVIAALLLIQVAAKEIGYWFGVRRAAMEQSPPEGVGIVVGGMLGLLAFVLALTLSFSSARFQERREASLAEANAIGTAWLRAQAVGEARGTEIARLLEEYLRTRIDFIRAEARSEELPGINARSNAMQTLMWGHVSAIVRERRDPIAGALMTALNETFDMATAARFAFARGFPPQLFWLLLGMAVACMMGLGFQFGLRRRPVRLLSLLLIGMWTVTITAIIDLGSARAGRVRIPTDAYEWTAQGFAGGVPIPPAPVGR